MVRRKTMIMDLWILKSKPNYVFFLTAQIIPVKSNKVASFYPYNCLRIPSVTLFNKYVENTKTSKLSRTIS